MKKVLTISLFLICFLTNTITAQDNNISIIKELNSKKANAGSVKIFQDDVISPQVAQYADAYTSDKPETIALSNQLVRGYRIQVFSGNNQNKSKEEAEKKRNLIKAEFPQHQTILQYDSPSWRLRVGNFTSRYEAEELLKELRKSFPSFGKEMYIVQDMVRKPID